MFCNISNVVPEVPVISKKSGLLYEKNLILKYIKENGSDPITKDHLSEEDLLEVKTDKVQKPRPINSNSVPGILQIFQNEWDQVMLESFQLKQYCTSLRQELSNAMYEKDAAVRVIARLIKEKEELKSQLAQISKESSVDAMEEQANNNPQFPQEVLSHFEKVAGTLSSKRKQREISNTLAPAQFVSNYLNTTSHPLHKTKPAGIRSMAIHPDKNLILTGGVDHSVILFNKDTDTILATLTGHKKQVSSVAFHNEMLISSSDDYTTRIWDFDRKSGQYSTSYTIKHHQGAITGLTCHPGGSFLVTTSRDKSWACFNMEGELIVSVPGEQEYTCGTFHPDGVILGTAVSDFSIPLWDLTSNSVVANFVGHTNEVTSMCFSENGYYLATGSVDGTCRLWDLRKQANIHTIDIGSAVNSVNFDHSGSYLAVGSDDVRVYQAKTWQQLNEMYEHTKPVTGVAFGKDAQYLASVSMDRHLKIWTSKHK